MRREDKAEVEGAKSLPVADQPRKPKGDSVDGPAHYKGYDVLEIINRYKLPFELGNTVKYILRAAAKGKLLEDLKKAKFYLDWYIERIEKEPVSSIG